MAIQADAAAAAKRGNWVDLLEVTTGVALLSWGLKRQGLKGWTLRLLGLGVALDAMRRPLMQRGWQSLRGEVAEYAQAGQEAVEELGRDAVGLDVAPEMSRPAAGALPMESAEPGGPMEAMAPMDSAPIDEVGEASEESFPASDAPGWTGTKAS